MIDVFFLSIPLKDKKNKRKNRREGRGGATTF
jgi:hypothetical protein